MWDVFPTLEQMTAIGIPELSMLRLYGFPIVVFSTLTLVWTVFSLEAGNMIGQQSAKFRPKDLKPETVILSAILAFLGLMLGFSYSFALGRMEQNRMAITHEAATTGTAYLRAELVPDDVRVPIQRALVEYAMLRSKPVTTRLRATGQLKNWDGVAEYIEKTDDLVDSIWPLMIQSLDKVEPPIRVAIVAATNEFLDSTTAARVAALNRMPIFVFSILFFLVGAASFVIGHYSGLVGHINRWHAWIFVFLLSGMITVIVDFDRPYEGWIRVNDTAVRALNADIIDVGTKRLSMQHL